MSWGDKTAAILAELKANPARSSRAIAASAGGVMPEYVRAVARRHGISVGDGRRGKRLSEENKVWLQRQAEKSSCTVPEIVNAIITDARCEADGDGNG